MTSPFYHWRRSKGHESALMQTIAGQGRIAGVFWSKTSSKRSIRVALADSVKLKWDLSQCARVSRLVTSVEVWFAWRGIEHKITQVLKIRMSLSSCRHTHILYTVYIMYILYIYLNIRFFSVILALSHSFFGKRWKESFQRQNALHDWLPSRSFDPDGQRWSWVLLSDVVQLLLSELQRSEINGISRFSILDILVAGCSVCPYLYDFICIYQ